MLKNKYAAIILYSCVVIVYIISLKCYADFDKHAKKELVGPLDKSLKELADFKSYFFTIWNFVIQIIFLLTAIVDESLKLLEFPLRIQKRTSRIRAILFNNIVFPSSLLVITVFWSLWHIDKELIFPKAAIPFFPIWLNHTLHTLIIVPLIIEIALPKKSDFIQFKNAAVVWIIYSIVYQLLYMSVYWRYGVWLYPIYKILSWPQRLAFPLAQMGIALVYQKIGIVLQNRKRTKLVIKTK